MSTRMEVQLGVNSAKSYDYIRTTSRLELLLTFYAHLLYLRASRISSVCR